MVQVYFSCQLVISLALMGAAAEATFCGRYAAESVHGGVEPFELPDAALRVPTKGLNFKETLMTMVNKPTTFEWRSCPHTPDLPVRVTYLTVKPDPIPLKGDVLFSIHLTSDIDVDAPLTLMITTEKYQFGSWEIVPCTGYWGTCTYEEICEILERLPTCPPQMLRKMKCKCPFEKGDYAIDDSKLNLKLPKYATGVYWTRMQLIHMGVELGCAEVCYAVGI